MIIHLEYTPPYPEPEDEALVYITLNSQHVAGTHLRRATRDEIADAYGADPTLPCWVLGVRTLSGILTVCSVDLPALRQLQEWCTQEVSMPGYSRRVVLDGPGDVRRVQRDTEALERLASEAAAAVAVAEEEKETP